MSKKLTEAQQRLVDDLRIYSGWLEFESPTGRWWLRYKDGRAVCARLVSRRTAEKLYDKGIIECSEKKHSYSNYRLVK